ncbi:MAG: carbohydrate kinase family protein, partial [Patescibacteria group bacterium]
MDDALDFLAIGDITTDNFIKLKNAEVTCEVDHTNCKISMPFGEKVPFEDSVIISAVGNASNASVSASRLGLKSGLVSWVGDDAIGKEDITTLKKEGVFTDFMEMQIDKKSNYHFVLLFGAERTILIKHENYNYILPKLPPVKWVYLSSFGENTLDLHQRIAKYLRLNPTVKLAFQPGTFQINLGVEKIKEIYSLSEIFFCNIEEAEKITGFSEDLGGRNGKNRKSLNTLEKNVKIGNSIVEDAKLDLNAFDWKSKFSEILE